MFRFRRWRAWAVFLTVLHLVLTPQTVHAQAQSPGAPQVVDVGGDGRDRMQITLTATAAGPNTATLVLTASPQLDAPGVTVQWEADGLVLNGGPAAETTAAVPAHGSVSSARTVVFGEPGIYPLGVTATYLAGPGTQYGASGRVFARVDAGGTVQFTEQDPTVASPMRSRMATEVIPQANAAGNAAPADSCVAVSGTVTRLDRMNTQSGRAAATRVPVRNALIELREEDTVFDDSYGTMVTNADGSYSFSACDDDGWFDDELEIYVRLRAELRVNGFTVVEVEDSSWIDEVYEYDSSVIDTEGGTYTVNFVLDETQSSVFNIADAVLDAWNFWNASGGAKGDDATFDYSAEVHWEPGYGDTISHYEGYVFDEMTIADDASDPDQWDDSVIIHEWGHMADDKYGCDDNPGGSHSFGSILSDPELAWGEGYPDYWQSAVRTATGATDGRFYIDANGSGVNRITLDMESIPTTANGSVEDSVARMLWDMNDSVDDGSDRTGFGHNVVQEVYTDADFESNGDVFDDTCTAFVYLDSWRDIGKATDAATAAAVTQNIGLSNPFAAAAGMQRALNAAAPAQTAGTAQVAAPQTAGGTPADYIWWQKVTLVTDNSASMEGTKFAAVKTVMEEQVNDLAPTPEGVEFAVYTFNNVFPGSQETVRGRFYPDEILPVIDGLATRPLGEAAEPCPVNALGALAASVQDQFNGQAWVYTDGDTTPGPGVETVQQLLTTRGLKGSFVLLGGCGSAPGAPPTTSGPEYNFLGKAADASQPTGIVPYLLTAIATGGQFLYVDQAKLADAAEILRAQLSHSAGAGRWSDYVSDGATYSWDRLTSWEYNWVDADDGDDDDGDGLPDVETVQGTPINATPVVVDLPMTFPVFGANFNKLRAFEDGEYLMGEGGGLFVSSFALDLLSTDLGWYYTICAAGASPDCGGATQRVITQDAGEWFAITTEGYAFVNGQPRAYQALLNKTTGEIRYQYATLQPGDTNAATIGVSFWSVFGASQDVFVSQNDVNGAAAGMGYKLVPMPPQPTQVYTVPVDSQTGSVGFLLTGYSGSFDPLAVTDPSGAAVSCADKDNVLCLDVGPAAGLVQYVQVNVNGRTGDWHAAVSAGATGVGTFSFSALAASPIGASSPFDHQLPVGKASPLFVKWGAATAGNQLTAWLRQPNGSRLGTEFTLFDDGAHGDGRAGDGLFALPDFVPPSAGVGYLTARGQVNGEAVQRTDATPYNFQPFSMEGPAEVAATGPDVAVDYTMTNLGSERLCYTPQFQLPTGWTGKWSFTLVEVINGFCLDPGQAETRTFNVSAPSLADPAPPRTVGEIALSFRETERGQIGDAITTRIVRYNPPARVELENYTTWTAVRPNGSDTVQLRVGVFDAAGYPVADGTVVNLNATLGTVTPAAGATVNGQLPVVFTAGSTPGDAVVTASVGALSAQTTIPIQPPLPEQITLAATPADLRDGTTAQLTAIVRDGWGNPVAGQTVRIGVENDGQSGTVGSAAVGAAAIAAAEVLTTTTDAQGRATAVFTKLPEAVGSVGVRAELLFDQGSGLEVVLTARRTIVLSERGAGGYQSFLPLIRRAK